MIRILVPVLAVCALAFASNAQDTGIAPASKAFIADYRAAASPLQGDFEYFTACYGRMSASLDLLDRIRGDLGGRVPADTVHQQGVILMNEAFARTYEALIDLDPALDLFAGERARQRGRAIFDEVRGAGLDIQYGRFRDLGALPDSCIATSERLRNLIAHRKR